MQNLSQLNGLNLVLGTFALAGLTGAATTHSHTASLVVAINGNIGTSPSGTTTPTTNSSATQVGAVSGALVAGSALSVGIPASGFRAALVVWTVDSAGTKRIRSNGFFASPGGDSIALEFPVIPPTEVPVAYHTVKVGTTLAATWTYGSSNWNATGVTIGTVVNTVGQSGVGAVVVS